MTVEAYLRSLVIGLDLPDEVLERCARSPIEVGLEPLDLNEDIDAVRQRPEPEPEPEPDEGEDNDGSEDVGEDDGVSAQSDDEEEEEGGDVSDETPDETPEDGDTTEEDDEEAYQKRIEDFQMRLDYASSNIYYAVLGVFSGGGYSEQVGDVKVTRSSYVITMADRERFKKLGDMLRRKWGWEVDDEDVNGIFDASFLRSVI